MESYMRSDLNLSLDVNYVLWSNQTFGNDNKSVEIYDTRDESLALIEISILSVMFISIVFGNSFVLMALIVRKPKGNRMYYYLQHLCVGDLMCGFFNVFPQLMWDITYRFNGGNLLCKVVKYLQILGPYLSSYILVITAIDRYQAICHPLRNHSRTQRSSQIMISIAWILSLVLCCPQLYIFSYTQIPDMTGVYDCWATFPENGAKIYVTWYAITVFFIPFIIILVTHVCICRKIFNNFHRKRESIDRNTIRLDPNRIRKYSSDCLQTTTGTTTSLKPTKRMNHSVKQIKANKRHTELRRARSSLPNIAVVTNGVNVTPRTHSLRSVSRAKIKTVKITIVIMLFYVLCSLPFICVQLWVHWFPQSEQFFATNSIVTILMLLSSLNSSINPYICLFFNQNLIKSMKEFFCQKNKRNENIKEVIGKEVNGFYNIFETKISTSQTEETSMGIKRCLSYRRSISHPNSSSTAMRLALHRNSHNIIEVSNKTDLKYKRTNSQLLYTANKL